MQDFFIARHAIEQELNQRRLEKPDPDGLAQYVVGEDALGGPTLRQRMSGLLARLRRGRKAPSASVEVESSTDYQPQH